MPIRLEASGKAPPIPQKQPAIDLQLQPFTVLDLGLTQK